MNGLALCPQVKPTRKPKAKRSPIARHVRPKARRETPRRSERIEDKAYLSAVRLLPCAARVVPGHVCAGSRWREADHAAKKRAAGQKCDDHGAIPMCSLAHRARHTFTECFRYFTKNQMRDWLDARIEETQRTIAVQERNRAALFVADLAIEAGDRHERALHRSLVDVGRAAGGQSS